MEYGAMRPVLTTEVIKPLPLRERASFFSRADNDLFQYLITKYKEILFSNKTDNITKKEKQKAWLAIHDEFNTAAEEARTIQKLKFKFHNTKTKARKSTNDERDGKKLATTSNDIRWMQSIMALTASEPDSDPDEDFCIDQPAGQLEKAQIEIVQYKPVKIEDDDDIEVPLVINEETNEEIFNAELNPRVQQKANCIRSMPDPLDTKKTNNESLSKVTPKLNSKCDTPKVMNLSKKPDNYESKIPVPGLLKVPPKVSAPQKKSLPNVISLLKTVPKVTCKPKNTPPVSEIASVSKCSEMDIVKKPTNYDKKLYKLRARHLQEQRDEDHQLFQLKKRKLLMEINCLLK